MYQQLFYFTSAEHAKSNIKKKRIKIATINSLNDPFEFSVPVKINGVVSEAAISGVKNHFDSRLGFICLNKAWYNPVHWTHYGDNHKGICLGFNVKKTDFQRIKYKKSRLTINAGKGFEGGEDPAYLKYVEQTLVKYKDWSYENECRVSIDLSKESVISENGLKFYPIDGEDLQLKSVMLGARASFFDDELADLLAEYGKVSVMQSKLCHKSFSVVNEWSDWKYYGMDD